MEKRLYRSRSDRVVSGVCGGLAEYFEIDPTLVRVAMVVLGLVTHGGILLAYLVMAVVVPEEPASAAVVAAEVAPAASGALTEEGFAVTENDTRPMGTAPAPEPAAPPTPPPAAPRYAPVPAAARPMRGLWWGVALIVSGMILLADQFVPNVDMWRFWPLVIVAIGLATVIKGVRR